MVIHLAIVAGDKRVYCLTGFYDVSPSVSVRISDRSVENIFGSPTYSLACMNGDIFSVVFNTI